jgi:hypothetical protein
MSWAHNVFVEDKKCRILAGKPIGRMRSRWEGNIKLGLRGKLVHGTGLVSSSTTTGFATGESHYPPLYTRVL